MFSNYLFYQSTCLTGVIYFKTFTANNFENEGKTFKNNFVTKRFRVQITVSIECVRMNYSI